MSAAHDLNRSVMFYLLDATTGPSERWSTVINIKDTHKTVENALTLAPGLRAVENRYLRRGVRRGHSRCPTFFHKANEAIVQ